MTTAEDGGLETYSFTKESTDDEGSWAYNKDSNIDMTSLMDLSKSLTAADMADWGLTFTLAPEAATVNGTECYETSSGVLRSMRTCPMRCALPLWPPALTTRLPMACAAA